MLAYARSDGQFLQDSLLQIFSSRFSSLPIPHGCDSGSKARWKVIRSRSSVADIGQVFNNVLQFADIAGPAVLMEYRHENCQQRVLPFADKLKWLPSSGSHFPYLPDHTGAQESWSTPLRYSLGDTPITSRKARANLLALS